MKASQMRCLRIEVSKRSLMEVSHWNGRSGRLLGARLVALAFLSVFTCDEPLAGAAVPAAPTVRHAPVVFFNL